MQVVGATLEVDGVLMAGETVYFLEVKKSSTGAAAAIDQLKLRIKRFQEDKAVVKFALPDEKNRAASSWVCQMDEKLRVFLSKVTSIKPVFLSSVYSSDASRLCGDAGVSYLFSSGIQFVADRLAAPL